MNSSAYSSVHTTPDAYPYSSAYSSCATQLYGPYADYASGLYEDPSSSMPVTAWSGESLALPAWSDADQALFEAFLTTDVGSTSPSGTYTVVPMRSPPSCDQEPRFLHRPIPIEPAQHHVERFHDSTSHSYATASPRSTASPAFERVLGDTAASCICPALIYPQDYEYDLEDTSSTSTSSQSSPDGLRAIHRTPSSSPYPYPSPSPDAFPPTSSFVIASQRRNAPARTAAPVPARTWKCPHCPYVQRNRRSPDLKRHIKTHTRGAEVADWVCCGVPAMNAIELGVPATTIREAQIFEFDGMLMTGGCRKAFSRRDALMRHLQREKGECFGDAQSLYQRGNRGSC